MFFRVQCQNEANVSVASLQTWHERLGHVNKRTLKEMAQKGIVNGFNHPMLKIYYVSHASWENYTGSHLTNTQLNGNLHLDTSYTPTYAVQCPRNRSEALVTLYLRTMRQVSGMFIS